MDGLASPAAHGTALIESARRRTARLVSLISSCGRSTPHDPHQAASRMTAYLLTMHLLNAMAPAVFLALIMAWVAPRWLGGRGARSAAPGWLVRWAWGTFFNGLVVLVGMALGATGKMQTYAALVLVSALVQFMLLRGWRV